MEMNLGEREVSDVDEEGEKRWGEKRCDAFPFRREVLPYLTVFIFFKSNLASSGVVVINIRYFVEKLLGNS